MCMCMHTKLEAIVGPFSNVVLATFMTLCENMRIHSMLCGFPIVLCVHKWLFLQITTPTRTFEMKGGAYNRVCLILHGRLFSTSQ